MNEIIMKTFTGQGILGPDDQINECLLDYAEDGWKFLDLKLNVGMNSETSMTVYALILTREKPVEPKFIDMSELKVEV